MCIGLDSIWEHELFTTLCFVSFYTSALFCWYLWIFYLLFIFILGFISTETGNTVNDPNSKQGKSAIRWNWKATCIHACYDSGCVANTYGMETFLCWIEQTMITLLPLLWTKLWAPHDQTHSGRDNRWGFYTSINNFCSILVIQYNN